MRRRESALGCSIVFFGTPIPRNVSVPRAHRHQFWTLAGVTVAGSGLNPEVRGVEMIRAGNLR